MEFQIGLKELITIGVLIGGMVFQYVMTLRQIDRDMATMKEDCNKRMDDYAKDLHDRITRNASECRDNEKSIEKLITDLRIEMVTEKNLEALETRLETKIDNAILKNNEHLLAEMKKMLESYNR